MSNFTDCALFVKTWLSNPSAVGAIAPSSARLGQLITSELRPGQGAVVELGPGTGVFTECMLQRGLAPSELVLIENDPAFARRLRSRFEAAQLHEIDVTRMREHAAHWQALQAQAVVSGLPLLTMGLRAQRAVMGSCFDMLRPGGAFYQFTYVWRCPIAPEVLDRLGLLAQPLGRVWRNLPPASVYRIVRRA